MHNAIAKRVPDRYLRVDVQMYHKDLVSARGQFRLHERRAAIHDTVCEKAQLVERTRTWQNEENEQDDSTNTTGFTFEKETNEEQ